MTKKKPKHLIKDREQQAATLLLKLIPSKAVIIAVCAAITAFLCVPIAQKLLSHEESRIWRAKKLMQELETAGMVLAPGLEVRATSYGGLGLFLSQGAEQGDLIISLPSSLMIPSQTDVNASSTKLHLLIHQESKQPSSEIRRLYMGTLPRKCPNNLAARAEVDFEAAKVSLHQDKVEQVRRELLELSKLAPDSTFDERRWAACIKMSRAFDDVLEPILDLINYNDEPSCSQVIRREHDGEWYHEIVAARPISAGDEVTMHYVEPSSHSLLLVTFGISSSTAPEVSFKISARLAAGEEPDSSGEEWLQEKGCDHTGKGRVDLKLDEHGELSQEVLRASIRCIRLRLYSQIEADWAVSHRYLDRDLDKVADLIFPKDDVGRFDRSLWLSVLKKDRMLFAKIGKGCTAALSPYARAQQRRLFAAASKDFAAAFQNETIALNLCSRLLSTARKKAKAILTKES